MVKLLNLFPLLLLVSSAQAGIWPEQFGPAKRLSVKTVNISDQKLWTEYGLQEAEQARYATGSQEFTAVAYRLQDSTDALGAFDWQRPKDAKANPIAPLAAQSGDQIMLAHANYLLIFQGYKPQAVELGSLYQSLPKVDQAPLPALPGYLPSADLVLNSQRYVIGPAGLAAFDPGIPAGVAAFHLGSEAQIGKFQGPSGEMTLAVFNYPTPAIARDRFAEMQKLPASVVKRSGPLVAVILAPPNADEAERLISQVRYQASISWDQYVPSRRDNIGDLVVNAFILIGVLLAFSTVAGLAYGGLRVMLRRGRKEDADAMTVLNL
jgi:hypothetical protein